MIPSENSGLLEGRKAIKSAERGSKEIVAVLLTQIKFNQNYQETKRVHL